MEHSVLTVTPKIEALSDLCLTRNRIDPSLFAAYDVKRGLRDINGNGVRAGLTNISSIISFKEETANAFPATVLLLLSRL